jgi:poly-gamma-glutamate synthesis protein (capsule biosynthesis protein)
VNGLFIFRKRFCLALIAALAFLLASCSLSSTRDNSDHRADDSESEAVTPAPDSTNPPAHDPDLTETMPEPEPEPDREALLLAVGDIMMHSPQIQAGYRPDTDSYAFDSFFSKVKPILEQGDWVVGNLETTLAGEDLKYTGYPMFNAPAELADALVTAGFQIITTANNHSMDRKETGVVRTLKELRSRGLIPVGTAESAEDSRRKTIVEKNGIKIGFAAYTYGTNGIPIPSDKPYLVNLIDEDTIVRDIRELRGAGAELIAISLHFGEEYQRFPNDEQIRLVQTCIEAGADIILGSHPHVVQPYQWFQVQQEDGSSRSAVAIYSLGNFISNQVGDYKDYGVIFGVKILKRGTDGKVVLQDAVTYPTWVHIDRSVSPRTYQVLPLETELATKEEKFGEQKYAELERMHEQLLQHLESYATPVVLPVTN